MAAVDLVKGKSIEEAKKLNDSDIFRVLKEIPAKKHHCIQLAVKTLQKALDEYQDHQNGDNNADKDAE
jgi:nitrogen fixation NifU-like protein